MSWPWMLLAVYAALVATIEAVFLVRGVIEKRRTKINAKIDFGVEYVGRGPKGRDVSLIASNDGKKTVQLEHVGYRVTGQKQGTRAGEFIYPTEYQCKNPLPHKIHMKEEYYIWKDAKALAEELSTKYGYHREAELRAFFEDDDGNKFVSKDSIRLNISQTLL